MDASLNRPSSRSASQGPSKKDGRLARWLLITFALLVLGLFFVVPIANIFVQALSKGVDGFKHTFVEQPLPEPGEKLSHRERRERLAQPEEVQATWSSVRMTLVTLAIVVPLNTLFGLAAAWAISKFRFRGKALLISLIDLPFSVSPVVAGLMFVLLFGRQGLLGKWATHFTHPDITSLYWGGFHGPFPGCLWPIAAARHCTGIIFSPLAIFIATAFVTFPFVVRTLLPLMQAQGREEEEAARSLGASGWKMFRRVTLPNIKWALVYGVVLCAARTIGEFGAVYVVSSGAAGTDTIPLRINKLYEGNNYQGAFALSAVLSVAAMLTLAVKGLAGHFAARQLRRGGDSGANA